MSGRKEEILCFHKNSNVRKILHGTSSLAAAASAIARVGVRGGDDKASAVVCGVGCEQEREIYGFHFKSAW
jgi:hypothetical protein